MAEEKQEAHDSPHVKGLRGGTTSCANAAALEVAQLFRGVGPSSCTLLDSLGLVKDGNKQIHFKQLLSFANKFTAKAQRLAQLLDQLHSTLQRTEVRVAVTPLAVAQHVFMTNSIEFESLPSAGDTLALIQGRLPKDPLNSRHLSTLQLYSLLCSTWQPAQSVAEIVSTVTPEQLIEWHRLMMRDLCEPGVRTTGVFTKGARGTHVYPMPSIIPHSLFLLCRCLRSCANQMFETLSGGGGVLYTFALAAFAQFHFVDIHPFVDGNGRMCRFLSKRILDSVCPLPFGMFPDRDQYLSCLVDGRREESPLDAPSRLLGLLLDCAIQDFTALVTRYEGVLPQIAVAVPEELSTGYPNLCDENPILLQTFKEMADDETRELEVRCGGKRMELVLHKLPNFSDLFLDSI